jgi:uncharacterized phage infection (PIP) family protein YhgE
MLVSLSEGRNKMSEDLTKKLPNSDNDKVNLILTAVQNLDTLVRSSIGDLVTWVGNIDSRLQNLEHKVEQRLYDTRPLWHKIEADIGQLQAGQQRLEAGQEALRVQMSELNSTVREVNRDQIVINDVIRRIQLDFHTIDERLHRLVINRNPQNSST